MSEDDSYPGETTHDVLALFGVLAFIVSILGSLIVVDTSGNGAVAALLFFGGIGIGLVLFFLCALGTNVVEIRRTLDSMQ